MTVAGAATVAQLAVYTADVSGGATLSGAAVTSYTSAAPTDYAYTGTGGLVAEGAATTWYEPVAVTPLTGGKRKRRPFKQWQPAPHIEAERPAEPRTFYCTATGGLQTGGSATTAYRRVRGYRGRGVVRTWGAASTGCRHHFTASASGGLRGFGQAPTTWDRWADRRVRELEAENRMLRAELDDYEVLVA
jgi:hypothetical protein